MRARLYRALVAPALLAATLALAGCGSSASPATPPTGQTPSGGQAPSNGGGTAGNWPAPQDQTFQGCPPQGDGGDGQLNIRKNRTDTGNWQTETVANIVSLPYPSGVAKQPRASWSSADAAAVAQSEGRPLQVEGYLLLVRHEGPESPNCHDPNQRDFHMWLSGSPGTSRDRATSLIVEVAPRARALNSGWAPDSRLLGLTGRHVRISGWLMLDQEHPEQVGKTRGTLWEVHPVMKIEVEQGSQWVNLNDGSLQISGGPADTTANDGSDRSSSSGSGSRTSHHRRRHSSSSGG